MENIDDIFMSETFIAANKQVDVALEGLQQDLYNLDRLFILQAQVVKDGASRIAMESLVAIAPEALPPESPVYTFTLTPSMTNYEIACEGFLDAIADGIAWLVKKIAETILFVINILVEIFSWLAGVDTKANKVKGNKKETEDLLRKSEEIELEYERLLAEYKATHEEVKRHLILITEVKVEHLEKRYNTELDNMIVSKVESVRMDAAISVCNAIVSMAHVLVDRVSEVFEVCTAMFKTGAHGLELTNKLKDMRGSVFFCMEGDGNFESEDKYIYIPYSYTTFFKILTAFGGIPPLQSQDLIAKETQAGIKMSYHNEGEQKRDAFWNAKITDRQGNAKAKNIYDGKRTAFYSKGLDVKHPTPFNIRDLAEAAGVSEFGNSVSEIDIELSKLEKRVKDLKNELNKFSTDKNRLIATRDSLLAEDPTYDASRNIQVWPENSEGYQAGQPIDRSKQTSLGFFTAQEIPIDLFRGSSVNNIIMDLVIAIDWLRGPFADASILANRLLNIKADYADLLTYKIKDIEKLKDFLK